MPGRLASPLLVLIALVSSEGLHAQIPEGAEGSFQPHPEAEEAISRLYSPFCPGFMLKVCTAAQSAALRDSIQGLAYQGWSADDLVEWMLANHGEEYRAVPEASGWGAFAWILPPLGLLAGVAIVVTALRRMGPTAGRAASGERGHEDVEKVISSEEQDRLRSAIREIELSEDPSF